MDYAAVIADLEAKRNKIQSVIDALRELQGSLTSSSQKDLAGAVVSIENPVTEKRLSPKPKSDGPPGTRQSPLRDAVRSVLRHGAKTSCETFDEVVKGFKTTSGSVYATLRSLEGRGEIERSRSILGGVAWKLKEPAA